MTTTKNMERIILMTQNVGAGVFRVVTDNAGRGFCSPALEWSYHRRVAEEERDQPRVRRGAVDPGVDRYRVASGHCWFARAHPPDRVLSTSAIADRRTAHRVRRGPSIVAQFAGRRQRRYRELRSRGAEHRSQN